MSVLNPAFQQYLASYTDEMNAAMERINNFALNKADANPNFDFTAVQNVLTAAQTSFMATVVSFMNQ